MKNPFTHVWGYYYADTEIFLHNDPECIADHEIKIMDEITMLSWGEEIVYLNCTHCSESLVDEEEGLELYYSSYEHEGELDDPIHKYAPSHNSVEIAGYRAGQNNYAAQRDMSVEQYASFLGYEAADFEYGYAAGMIDDESLEETIARLFPDLKVNRTANISNVFERDNCCHEIKLGITGSGTPDEQGLYGYVFTGWALTSIDHIGAIRLLVDNAESGSADTYEKWAAEYTDYVDKLGTNFCKLWYAYQRECYDALVNFLGYAVYESLVSQVAEY